MPFLTKDEHLIYMSMQLRYEDPLIRLPEEDIITLVDAGIRTSIVYQVDWNVIEPVQGQRSWAYYDDLIGMLNRCGMKTIVLAFSWLPDWIPPEWLIMDSYGNTAKMISPWNDEAWSYALGFIQELHDRYTVPGQSMSMNSWLTDGETLFPNDYYIYDQHAQAAFAERYNRSPEMAVDALGQREEFLRFAQVKMMYELQSIHIENENREIWYSLHPALEGYHGNGCDNIESILQTWRAAWPEANINHLYCTWVMWHGYWPKMNAWRAAYGENSFGGAEYAEGVVGTTRAAIDNGLRGLLINPCHPYTGHTRVEDWMLDNIRESLKLW